jgi:signal transduction histidine kinase
MSTFFSQNLSHELNTPLAKLKLLNEDNSDSAMKMRMNKQFEKLEQKIEAFTTISTLLDKESVPTRECCVLDSFFEQLSYQYLEVSGDTMRKIEVNRALFSMMIEHLVENAQKYSTDFFAYVEIQEHQISIKNRVLDESSRFEQAWMSLEQNMHKGGLGLYFSKLILEAHKLPYSHTSQKGWVVITIEI